MSFKQALFLDQFVTAMFPTSGVGIRGIGGERATLWGQNFEQHVEECAAEPPFVVPLLETHPAYLNRVEIAQVDGIDWCQLGPADHSASKGYAGEWEVSYPHAPQSSSESSPNHQRHPPDSSTNPHQIHTASVTGGRCG